MEKELPEKVKAAIENVYRLSLALSEDSTFAIRLRESLGDTPETRRVYVRTLFAFVEGMTHALKRFALAVHEERERLFTEAEVTLLRGVTYELDDKGEAYEQPRFLRFASNVRLAIRAFSRAEGYDAERRTTMDRGGSPLAPPLTSVTA